METAIILGLSVNAWLTIALVITMFSLMMFTKIPAEFVFLGGMGFLYVTGILSVEEAMAGFSSTSVITVGVLFVIIAGLVHSGVIHWMVRHLLGTPSSYTAAIVRLMVPVAVMSSVLSNTTVVALFIKVVKVWSKKLGITPSKLLIPLSYASCLGGICTIIGTPPNLIISGMLHSDTSIELSFFSTTLPGLFCLAIGIVSMIAMKKMLPERLSADAAFEATNEYTAELLVPSNCAHIGQTVSEANLLHPNGGRLIEIVRFDKEVISPVPADEFIMGADRLVYAGQIDSILELKKTHGLTTATQPVFSVSKDEQHRQLFTAHVLRGSSLIGTSMEESDFEESHNTVLVAVVREGERFNCNPRSVAIERGDTLLFECQPGHGKTFKNSVGKDLQIFQSDDIPNIGKKTVLSSAIMLLMILLSTAHVLTLLQACFLAAFAMLLTRCCTPQQASDSISWDILMIFAGSVCLGTAIDRTGIATIIADNILGMCGSSPIMALICICLVATFATEFISNTAAAAIFYPIAYQTATSLGANPITFCIALMLAVSSSFATPIGSPTHMMVYGEGGYRFSDFMKVGLIMNLVILAANIFIVTLLFPLSGH